MLTAYWFTFPDEPNFPLGIGVTAFSRDDAVRLMEAAALQFHLKTARVEVREGITLADLDQRNVVVRMGPIVVRGVWYPLIHPAP